MRVYELAKQLGVESSEVLAAAAAVEIQATAPASGVDEAEAIILRKYFEVKAKEAAETDQAKDSNPAADAETGDSDPKAKKPKPRNGAKKTAPPSTGEAKQSGRRRRPLHSHPAFNLP